MTMFQSKNSTRLKDLDLTKIVADTAWEPEKNRPNPPLLTRKVAIIGMAGKAGKADHLDKLWQILCDGIECSRVLPETRMRDVEAYLRFRGRNPASELVNVPRAAYLDDIAGFDYQFFGISQNEAAYMDPNQRIFLETVWHALEDAGYAGENIKGSDTGVYVGFSNDFGDDYRSLVSHTADTSPEIAVSGNIKSIIASRISYFLDLQGPAVMLDTACSSGLTAMYEAVNAVRTGLCKMAVAGSVKVLPLPLEESSDMGIGIKDIQNITAGDFHTRTFDDQCDGTGIAEGAFAFILKSYERAVADGDHIHAVITGGAVNQDGASNGITSPSSNAQEKLITAALADAKARAEDISYIEAHGTATKLGDPIEIDGITRAFRRLTSKKQFCGIGSLKTNMGHLDNSSGLGGLAKVVLAMKHNILPESINFKVPNRNINFIQSPVYVNSEVGPWSLSDHNQKTAFINSFGISGTNCNLVVESYDSPADRSDKPLDTYLLLLSSKTKTALKKLAEQYWLNVSRDDLNLTDLIYTAAVGRMHLETRAAFVFRNRKELCEALKCFIKGEDASGKKIIHGTHRIVANEKSRRAETDITDLELTQLESEADKLLDGITDGKWDRYTDRLSELYVKGVRIDWKRLFDGLFCKRISLPQYPFQHRRCWLSFPLKNHASCSGAGGICKDQKLDAMGHTLYRYEINEKKAWELNEHVILGQSILPGTALIQRMIDGVNDNGFTYPFIFTDITFHSLLAAKKDQSVSLHMLIKDKTDHLRLQLSSLNEQKEWLQHCDGKVIIGKKEKDQIPRVVSISDLKKGMIHGADLNEETDKQRGIVLGERFSDLINDSWRSPEYDEILLQICLPGKYQSDLDYYSFHPSLIDMAVNAANNINDIDNIFLPLHYGAMTVYSAVPAKIYSHIRPKTALNNSPVRSFDINIYDMDGRTVLKIEDYHVKILTDAAVQKWNSYGARQTYRKSSLSLAEYKTSGPVLAVGKLSQYTKAGMDLLADRGVKIIFLEPVGEDWLNKLPELQEKTFELAIFEWFSEDNNVISYAVAAEEKKAMTEALSFLKLWVRQKINVAKGLDVITYLGRIVDGSEKTVMPMQAALNGFWHVAGMEYTDLKIRVIDCDHKLPLESMLKQLFDMEQGDDLSIRKEKAYLKTIKNTAIPEIDDTYSFSDEGVYVVTGGTGDLGIEAAGLLARKKVKNLVLLGGGSLPEKILWEGMMEEPDGHNQAARIKKIMELEAMVDRLIVRNIRIQDFDEVEEFLSYLRKEVGPIKGILHLAAKPGDGYLLRKTPEVFLEVYDSKAIGARNLHVCTRRDKLDFFICFSSVNSILHFPGQADYTAANLYLDSLMEKRMLMGLPALSLQWPAWRQTGMAYRMGAVDEEEMFAPVNTDEALKILTAAITNSPHYTGVIVSGRYERPAKKRRLYRSGTERDDGTETEVDLTGVEDPDDIYLKVAAVWSRTLGLKEMDVDEEFERLGGNSLLSSQMLRHYDKEFPELFNIIDLFTYNTIYKQSEYIKTKTGAAKTKDKDTESLQGVGDTSPGSLDAILASVLEGELSVEDSFSLLDNLDKNKH